MERQDAASLHDCSEENRLRPFEAYSQSCGRCAAQGKGPPLSGSGNVVSRRRSSLTVGTCEWVAGGGSLEKRASPGWEGSQEG